MKIKILTILAVIAWSCNNDQKPHITNTSPAMDIPDDFETFYKRFHEDTSYQMEHIVWPLPGRPSMFDTTSQYEGGAYQWERKDWVYHKPFNDNGEFDREFEVVSDFIINETYTHTQMPITVLRRFAKTSDGWRLIFYAGPGD